MQRKSLAWRLYLGLMTLGTISTLPKLFHVTHAIDFLQIVVWMIAWLGLVAYVNGLSGGPPMFWRIFACVFACNQVFAIGRTWKAGPSTTQHAAAAMGYSAGIVLAMLLMLLLMVPMMLACLRLGGLFLRADEKPHDYRTVFT